MVKYGKWIEFERHAVSEKIGGFVTIINFINFNNLQRFCSDVQLVDSGSFTDYHKI